MTTTRTITTTIALILILLLPSTVVVIVFVTFCFCILYYCTDAATDAVIALVWIPTLWLLADTYAAFPQENHRQPCPQL